MDDKAKATTVKRPSFEQELTSLINSYSKENDSDTPDYILGEYMRKCLDAFNEATIQRDKWWNFKTKIS
jgi:hypothetical protein